MGKERRLSQTLRTGILSPLRLPFLVLAPTCFLLGLGTAFKTGLHINPLHAILALLATLTAHVSVNVFNEYFDFKSGLDGRTRRTPFSGGSGALPGNPVMAGVALLTALISFLATLLIGVYFAFSKGAAILPLWLTGLLIIIAYTPWITRHPLLCHFAPGLGFGPLMVMATHFALTGRYSWSAFAASLVPFFLVSNLLLLNQFPDVEADESVGRRHMPIVIGRRRSGFIYGLFLALAYLALIAGVAESLLPAISLLGLLTVVIAAPVFLNAVRHSEDLKKLVPFMGLNVILTLLTPLLVAVGLFVP